MAQSSDLTAEIKKAVKEVLAEEKSKEAKPSKSDKGQTKQKVVYDETRKTGADLRDPRTKETQWPCHGQHNPKPGGNRFAKWETCQRCGLRTSYTPSTTAPAQTMHCDHQQNVVEALHRLRNNGWSENDLTETQVRAMITIVAKEYQLIKPKAKAFGPPSREKSKAQAAAQAIASDGEDFQVVATEATK